MALVSKTPVTGCRPHRKGNGQPCVAMRLNTPAQDSRSLVRVAVGSPALSAEVERNPQARSTIALKEWNVANQALHRGLQTILVRKGGIREPVFKPPGRQFLLFPTSFHSQQSLLKPGVRDTDWCKVAMALEPKECEYLVMDTYVEVTGAWVTEDAGVLEALDDLHIWTQEFVDARLKWRSKQPLTLLELRAWQLRPPTTLKVDPEFFGCFSFVDLPLGGEGKAGLDRPVGLEGAVPALADVQFAERQQLLRSRLANIEHQALVL